MNLRPQQQLIADYTGGLAAVSAVPGSGKTHTLAALGTRLLIRGLVPDEAEVLVVTFTTSAVDNIRNRIRATLAKQGLTDSGYRVLTLHGLAHMIVRERPDLAGTTSDFRVDDELSGRQSMPDAARWFTLQQADYWHSFLPSDLSAQQRYQVEEQWRTATEQMGEEVTRLAKNLRLTPADVLRLIAGERGREGERERGSTGAEETLRGSGEEGTHLFSPSPPLPLTPSPQLPSSISPFLGIGVAIYERYEHILNLGGRLDFDDLIWRAIMALENDDEYRKRLGERWPFILEDEAQDSTPLQEKILTMLSHEHRNWVRVGDPNQAIMTTFTASDVRFFREFIERPDVTKLPLSVSGRSAQPIIDMANRLADWAVLEHPEPDVRTMALTNAVRIHPTGDGDGQPNPAAQEARIHVQHFTSEDGEAQKVAQNAVRFVLQHPERTCAILVPTNYFGRAIVAALKTLQARHPDRPIFQDQLRNSLPVRNIARVLAQAVRFCSTPTNTGALVDLRKALVDMGIGSNRHVIENRMNTLLRSVHPERLLFPSPAAEPALPANVHVGEHEQQELQELSNHVSKWLRASVLPIDQLVLTVGQDVLASESDLAIAHSLALSLRRLAAVNPQMQLADLARELDDIADNRQKYLSNALIESGFEPVQGVVTVTTMHKAKGLEWDRVYLTGVDQVEFPHEVGGQFRGEQWFLGGHDPATEARKQLEALARGDDPLPGDIELIRRARLEYIAERLRLLYVGITRAKRELVISYSRERHGHENELALAVRAVLREGMV